LYLLVGFFFFFIYFGHAFEFKAKNTTPLFFGSFFFYLLVVFSFIYWLFFLLFSYIMYMFIKTNVTCVSKSMLYNS
jgi:hypothetical protein